MMVTVDEVSNDTHLYYYYDNSYYNYYYNYDYYYHHHNDYNYKPQTAAGDC